MSVTDASAVLDVADRLFNAIEDGDIATVEQLFSPDVEVWHSGDARDSDHARSVRIIAWFVGATVQRRYEVLDRQVFDGGFVQQHVLHATGHAGATMRLRVCIVIKVSGSGLITRVDEYFDPADMAALLADRR